MIDNAAVARAARKLELRDIALHTCSLTRDESTDPKLYPISVRASSNVQVAVDQLVFNDENNNEFWVLRAFVRFSLAAFDGEDESRTGPLFEIRAEYFVDYLVKKRLTDLELKVFGDYNAVHNVWPFWRQHVQHTISQASLPRVAIPLFRRPPGTPKAKRTPRTKAITKRTRSLH